MNVVQHAAKIWNAFISACKSAIQALAAWNAELLSRNLFDSAFTYPFIGSMGPVAIMWMIYGAQSLAEPFCPAIINVQEIAHPVFSPRENFIELVLRSVNESYLVITIAVADILAIHNALLVTNPVKFSASTLVALKIAANRVSPAHSVVVIPVHTWQSMIYHATFFILNPSISFVNNHASFSAPNILHKL